MPQLQQEMVHLPEFGRRPVTRVRVSDLGGRSIQLKNSIRSISAGPFKNRDLKIVGIEGSPDEITQNTLVLISRKDGGNAKGEMFFLISALANSEDICFILSELLTPRRQAKGQ